jgi:hypothetical protein
MSINTDYVYISQDMFMYFLGSLIFSCENITYHRYINKEFLLRHLRRAQKENNIWGKPTSQMSSPEMKKSPKNKNRYTKIDQNTKIELIENREICVFDRKHSVRHFIPQSDLFEDISMMTECA